ncbi:aminodeoxychorismate lyase [Vibrio maerlii]|uniref:aminodeoxychorismate lyase n=1 Tax=Vibrio maerlii TaxID=2231648 RepID=UPI000E3E06B7|nr:aminodeoxychorismate lyase [Vibrio maerlii]
MYWLNGTQADSISLTDRSFQYGDGCFTTILVKAAEPQWLTFHIERMEACLKVLGIPVPCWAEVIQWLSKAAIDAPLSGLKLHISRGSGGRGYSPSGVMNPDITISAFDYPQHYHSIQSQGIELGLCEAKLGINPMLAGHKHNNRLEQILLKAEMDRVGLVDGVVLDIHDHVVETTMANLFWCKDKTIYTPSLEDCGVSGIVRRLIIQDAEQLGHKAVIGKFDLDHLANADEVFISNSILGVAPVIKVGQYQFRRGPMSRQYQERYFQC